MALNKTMTFDLELKPGGIPPIVHASQGDIGRMFKANIYWDGSAATSYVSGATVNLRGRKPDKTVFDYSATLAGSMVTFETTEQMTIISGPVECELVFSNDGDVIASANFVLIVEESPYNPDALSESVIPGIVDLIEDTIGGDVRDEVQAELEAHPEWTTTVQDGAITKAKINTAFLPEIENAYVTPEMFGAVGDGVTDDTVAIQAAIDNTEKKAVYFSSGATYKTTAPVQINETPIINNGVINYTGTDYALVLAPNTNIDGANYNLGKIEAPSGGCLKLDSENGWLQYINIGFVRFRAASGKSAAYIYIKGTNWINEIRFHKGRFFGCENGVYVDHSEKTSSYATSHYTFEEIGLEGCTNAINIPDNMSSISFVNCRAEESVTNVVFSRATTEQYRQSISWFGSQAKGAYWKNATNYTVQFLNGFIDEAGTFITDKPIVFYNGNLVGLQYKNGNAMSMNDFSAYSYDSETGIQTSDFKTVFDYTGGSVERLRLYTRRYTIPNNTAATTAEIKLDNRMFFWSLPYPYDPINSYLLNCTLSPNKTLKIYSENGTQIYSKTGGSTTTYPQLVVSKSGRDYYVEEITITRKQV